MREADSQPPFDVVQASSQNSGALKKGGQGDLHLFTDETQPCFGTRGGNNHFPLFLFQNIKIATQGNKVRQ